MDQAAEGNFVAENPETAPGSSSERITEVMDLNESVVDGVPDMQSKCRKNKIENAKSKIENDKIKKMAVASDLERKSLKRKAAHPPTSEMVMDSIKVLKKRNGASFEDIRKYMEEKYVVNMKLLKHHVDNFLQKSVDNGVLQKIDRGRAEGRFKINKSENIKKDSKTLPRKEEKVKPGKKVAATIKQVKDSKKLPRKEGKVKPEMKMAATKKQVKDSKNLPRKEGKLKPEKKIAATKKQVKK